MNPIAAQAETALRRHAHPALRLSELLELVAERIDRGLDARRLRAILEEHPERFRLLDPWRGPWRSASAPAGPHTMREDGWVVLVTDPAAPPCAVATSRMAFKLRESVRWLGRAVDVRSSVEVSRWYAIVLAERASREAIARRAA
jgi:hypothetical protein